MGQRVNIMDNPKKSILHVLVRLDYGGIETWLVNVLRNYNRQKFQMDVCLVGRRGEIGILGKQAEAAGSLLFVVSLRNPFLFIRKFKQLAANYEAVLVHTDISITSFILFAALLGGVKHRLFMLHNTKFTIPIRTLRGNQSGILLYLGKVVFKFLNRILATGILGCSMTVLDQNYPGWREHHLAEVLYLGIDLERFMGVVNINQLRESLGIPKDALVVGHIGRFYRQKNHYHFICVAKYLSAIDPNIHFLLVGDGPLRPEIETQIKNVDLQKRFHLTGIRDDIPELMKIMDIAYFPSLHEGFPITFIEAQVSGLVLVTIARPEMCEAVCPKNHQWCVVEDYKIENSGDSIFYLLSNPDLRSQLAIHAQMWAIEKFSIKKSTLSLEDILIRNLEGI